MINEEKVILMTQASLFESRKGKEELKITRYFRHDYISLQMLYGWFFMTVSFVLCAALWGACNMEYLLDNLHKMDLKKFGSTILLMYALAVGVYLIIVYAVCSYRYHRAKRRVGSYVHTLRKISDIYTHEEKGPVSGTLTEETENDRFT